ncbi:three component ABC system middle component [Mucilaginibacter antarcticus]|uniref:Three component ABC system middle component n=1 Tax=Mucilaginibacter antarcticus TaxID=1855725 RepID=A0ABW5XVC1_9SPHI
MINEFEIFQNKAIGAHIIWEFSKNYQMHHREKASPSLVEVMPVLPLCLNKRVVSGIKERNFKGGSLLRAIDENKDLFSGLQERMEDMAPLTLQSIYIGAISGLITYD